MYKILAVYALILSHVCHSSTYIFAPGFANTKTHTPAIQQAITFAKSLNIVGNTQLDVQLGENGSSHDALAWTESLGNTLYIPIFSDCDARCTTTYICQEKDIADIFRAHCIAIHNHGSLAHFIGHSRGAGSILVYLGLLNYDLTYLIQLAQRHWPEPAQNTCITPYSHDTLRAMLHAHTGALLLFAPFDHLEETMYSISRRQLPFFSSINKAIGRYIVHPLRNIFSQTFAGITYTWNATYTPRNLVTQISSHIPMLCVHAAQDPLIPQTVTLDVCRKRTESSSNAFTHSVIIPQSREHANIANYIHQSNIAETFAELQDKATRALTHTS